MLSAHQLKTGRTMEMSVRMTVPHVLQIQA